MRYLIAITLLATACTDVPFSGPRYDSVRERLSDEPTSLYIRDEASSGTITARRRGPGGWSAGTAQLAIEHGYTRAVIDGSGELAIDQLEIAIGPIALDDVFASDATLQDLRLRLAEPVRSTATWTSANDGHAIVVVVLDFSWSIAFDGSEPFPLAMQRLAPQTAEITLAGNGEYAELSLDLEATGELWSWADLVQITNLALALTAETAD